MAYRMRNIPIIMSIITLVIFLSSPTFADVFFASNVNYSTGSYPMSVATGDFNSDEKLDAVTVNTVGGMSIFLGKGDGTFQAKNDIIVAGPNSLPKHITTGDFNNDGKLDVATSSYNNALAWITMSVVLGNGDGTFQAPIIYMIGPGGNAYGITTGDFNGDRNLDIAVSYYGSVAVFIGNGDGTFQAKKDYGAGSYDVFDVITTDINGDGKLDIITENFDTYSGKPSTVSVLLGKGDGSFLLSTVLEVGGYARDVVFGDFNGDGNEDIATIKNDYDMHKDIVSVFIGNGDGTYQTRKDYDTGTGVGEGGGAIVAADINGDGKLDLTTASFMAVSILIGNGDGTFQSGSNVIWESGYYTRIFSLSSGDFNKDGKIDLVAVGERNHAMSVFINTTQNRPPVADAGHAQVIECAGPSGAFVTLDGSGSHDPDEDILTYKWVWTGGTTEGIRPQVQLPLGTTLITLTVNDGKASSNANVSITIQDTASPIAFTVLDGTRGNNNLFISEVTVNLTASDNCSGVKEIQYTIDGVNQPIVSGSNAVFSIGTDASHNVSYVVIDNGNNHATGSLSINIDKTAPTITGAALTQPNANGWYNGDVTVHFTATDALSGIANITPDTMISTEGTGQAITGTAEDKAGNSSSYSVTGINVDKMAPVIVITGITNGATYNLGLVPLASYTVTDALSGVATSSGNLTGGDVHGVGQFIYAVTATDKAGNTITTTIAYTVNPAILTVTSLNASRVYGAINPTFSASYSGFVNNDTVSVISGSPVFSTTATTSSPVGSYPVFATTGNLSSTNYTFFFVPGVLTINKANANIILDNLTQAYDGTARDVTVATNPPNLPVIITYNGSSAAPVNVGTYAVIAVINDPNYQGSATGTLTITSKPKLAITANPSILWPANHKLVPVTIGGGVVLNSNEMASLKITVSDEYGKYNYSGLKFGDIVKLEASRKGDDKNGRTYTITAVLTLKDGRVFTAATTVKVPHDMSGDEHGHGCDDSDQHKHDGNCHDKNDKHDRDDQDKHEKGEHESTKTKNKG